jgi:hypothetical protein
MFMVTQRALIYVANKKLLRHSIGVSDLSVKEKIYWPTIKRLFGSVPNKSLIVCGFVGFGN